MRILVTGGAGYLGSHTIRELIARGDEVVALDNIERGHREALQALAVPLLEVDLRDAPAVQKVVAQGSFDGAVHFAAFCSAGESVAHPERYFGNNVVGTINLLNAMVEAGIKKLVFSSTCAVYGQPKSLPVTEEAPHHPESPYGESKELVERMLPWYDLAHGIKTVALRYFNACGSSVDGLIGDDSRPVSRLIPSLMKAALGQNQGLTLFGVDYPTPDGTCIRDYIHALDLASAHILALDYLKKGGQSDFLNVGTGQGFSNREIIEMVKSVTGVDFPVATGPRRPGDPAKVYADNSKIKRVLGWKPRFSDLRTVIETDWTWHKNHPNGYDTK